MITFSHDILHFLMQIVSNQFLYLNYLSYVIQPCERRCMHGCFLVAPLDNTLHFYHKAIITKNMAVSS